MQFGDIHAYLRGDQLVVNQPYLEARQFTLNNGHLRSSEETDLELVDIAKAYAEWPMLMYRQQKYHLPENTAFRQGL
jgi:hypothetical protein